MIDVAEPFASAFAEAFVSSLLGLLELPELLASLPVLEPFTAVLEFEADVPEVMASGAFATSGACSLDSAGDLMPCDCGFFCGSGVGSTTSAGAASAFSADFVAVSPSDFPLPI